MSNIKVVDVIERVNTIVVDTTKTRWPYEELLTWYNDAVLAVVNRRPDASIKNIDFTITPNKSKQTLPVDGLRWMDVVSNVLTGKPIRKTKRLQLDDQVVMIRCRCYLGATPRRRNALNLLTLLPYLQAAQL